MSWYSLAFLLYRIIIFKAQHRFESIVQGEKVREQFFPDLQKFLKFKKYPLTILAKPCRSHFQNCFWMLTFESQNILLEVNFRKSKYITGSRLPVIYFDFRKSTSENNFGSVIFVALLKWSNGIFGINFF